MGIQELLKKNGLQYEELNYQERETLEQISREAQKAELTIPQLKERFRDLMDIVNTELAGISQPSTIWEFLFRRRKDIFLKARLKNYMVIYNALNAPDKFQKMIDEMFANVSRRK